MSGNGQKNSDGLVSFGYPTNRHNSDLLSNLLVFWARNPNFGLINAYEKSETHYDDFIAVGISLTKCFKFCGLSPILG